MNFIIGVAFKKQREVSPIHYKLSAEIATGFMDIVCTSGTKTGSAPDVEKIKQFREGCGREKVLAVASGITPDNITEFIPYLDCVLVATGNAQIRLPEGLGIHYTSKKVVRAWQRTRVVI